MKFSNELQENSDEETKIKFFRYNYAPYFEQISWVNDALGEYFEEVFEIFCLKDFKYIASLQRCNMRTLLQHRGVFVPISNKASIENTLFDLILGFKMWDNGNNGNPVAPTTSTTTTPDLEQPQSTGEVKSIEATITANSTILVYPNKEDKQNPIAIDAPRRLSKSSSYALQLPFKTYIGDEKNYSGAPTENLCWKLALFLERWEHNHLGKVEQPSSFSIKL